MTSNINLEAASGSVDHVQTFYRHNGQVSDWFPGRFLANVRMQCSCVCILARVSEQVQHCHIDYRLDEIDSDALHQADMGEVDDDPLVNMRMTVLSAKSRVSQHLASIKCNTVNDWRFTRNPNIVEMKLDAPGTDSDAITTLLPFSFLSAVRKKYWTASKHNGGYRVLAVSDAMCVHSVIERLEDLPVDHRFDFNLSTQDTTPPAPIYLQHIILPQVDQRVVVHIDGNMLNNCIDNLKRSNPDPHQQQFIPLEELQFAPSSPQKPLAVVESGGSSHSSPIRHTKRYHMSNRVRTNSKTGVNGMSVSEDNMRIFVRYWDGKKHQRKTFNVPMLFSMKPDIKIELEEEELRRREDLQAVAFAETLKAAKEFHAVNHRVSDVA